MAAMVAQQMRDSAKFKVHSQNLNHKYIEINLSMFAFYMAGKYSEQ